MTEQQQLPGGTSIQDDRVYQQMLMDLKRLRELDTELPLSASRAEHLEQQNDSLKRQLSKLLDIQTYTQDRLQQLERQRLEQWDEVSLQLRDYAGTVSQLQDTIKQKDLEIVRKSNELSAALARSSDAQAKGSPQNTENVDLISQGYLMQQRIEQLQEQCERSRGEVRALKGELEGQLRANIRLKEELDNTYHNLNLERKQKEDTTQELSNMRLKEELIKQGARDQVRQSLISSQSAQADLELRLRDMQNHLIAEKNNSSNLLSMLNEQKGEAKELQAKIEKLGNEVVEKDRQLAKQHADIQALVNQQSDYIKKISDGNKTYRDVNEKQNRIIRRLQQKISVMSRDVEAQKQRVEDLQNNEALQFTKQQNMAQNYEQQLDEAQQSQDNLKQQLQTAENNLKSANEQIAELNGKIETERKKHERTMKKKENEIAQEKDANDELQAQIAGYKQQIQQLEADYDEQAARLADKEATITQQIKEKQSLEETIKFMDEKLSQTADKVQNQKQQLRELSDALALRANENQELVKRSLLANEIEKSAKQEVAELDRVLEEYHSEKMQLERACRHSEQNIEEKEQQIDRLKREITMLQGLLDKGKEQHQQDHAQIMELQKELRQQQAEIDRSLGMIDRSRNQMALLNDNVNRDEAYIECIDDNLKLSRSRQDNVTGEDSGAMVHHVIHARRTTEYIGERLKDLVTTTEGQQTTLNHLCAVLGELQGAFTDYKQQADAMILQNKSSFIKAGESMRKIINQVQEANSLQEETENAVRSLRQKQEENDTLRQKFEKQMEEAAQKSDQHQEKVDQLNRWIDQLKKDGIKKDQDLQQLQRDMQTVQQERETLTELAQERDRKIQELKQYLEAASKEKGEMVAQLEEVRQQVDMKQDKLVSLEQQFDRWRNEYTDQVELLKASIQQSLQQQEEKCEQLQTQCDQLGATLTQQQQMVQEYDKIIYNQFDGLSQAKEMYKAREDQLIAWGQQSCEELQNQLQQEEEKQCALRATITKLGEENGAQQQVISEQREQIHNQLIEMQDIIQKQEAELSYIAERNGQAVRERDERLRRAQHELGQRMDSLTLLNKELAHCRMTMVQQDNKLGEQDKRMKMLEEQAECMEQLKTEKQQLQEQLDRAHDEKNKTDEVLRLVTKEKDTLQETQHEIQKCTEQNEDLRRENAKLNEVQKTLRAQLEEKEGQIQQYNKYVQNMQQRQQSVVVQPQVHGGLRQQLRASPHLQLLSLSNPTERSEPVADKHLVEQLTQQTKRLQTVIREKNVQIKQLETKLDQQHTNSTTLEQSIKQLQKQQQTMQSELQSTAKQADAQNAMLGKLRAAKNKQQGENQVLLGRIEDLESSLTQQRHTIDQQKAQIGRLKQHLEESSKLDATNMELEGQNEALNKDIGLLRSQLRKAQQQVQLTEQKCADSETEIQRQAQQLGQQLEQIQTLKQLLKEEGAKNSQLEEQFQTVNQQIESMISKRNSQMQIAESINREQNAKIQGYEEHFAKLQSDRDELMKQNKQLQYKLWEFKLATQDQTHIIGHLKEQVDRERQNLNQIRASMSPTKDSNK